MINNFKRDLRTSVVLLASMVVSPFTHAQLVDNGALKYPELVTKDSNNVDLTSLSTHFSLMDLSIGAGDGKISHTISSYNVGFFVGGPLLDNFIGGMAYPPRYDNLDPNQQIMVHFGDFADRFHSINGVWIQMAGKGATLFESANFFTYTSANGTVYTIDKSFAASPGTPGTMGYKTQLGLVTKVQYPNGRIVNINAKQVAVQQTQGIVKYARIQSVTSNNGLQFKYRYAVDGTPTSANYFDWLRLVSVTAVNNAVEYCDPLADICNISGTWPQVSYSWDQTLGVVAAGGTIASNALTVMLPAGGTYKYTSADQFGRTTGYKPASSPSADTIKYTWCNPPFSGSCSQNQLVTAIRGAATFNYYASSPPVEDAYVEHGGGAVYDGPAIVRTRGALHSGPMMTIIDTDYNYLEHEDSDRNVPVTLTKIDGEVQKFYYDGRANLTQITSIPKSSSTLANIVRTAGYDPTCTNLKTCNQPNWVKDGNQQQTDYTYDPAHGGVLTITWPAVNSIRPQKRLTYVQRKAWFLSSSGQYVQSSDPIWLVATSSTCMTGAALGAGCAVASDEILTTYYYGPDSGPNNLFLRGESISARGEVHTTCYGYDKFGNLISQTSPNAGLTTCP